MSEVEEMHPREDLRDQRPAIQRRQWVIRTTGPTSANYTDLACKDRADAVRKYHAAKVAIDAGLYGSVVLLAKWCDVPAGLLTDVTDAIIQAERAQS